MFVSIWRVEFHCPTSQRTGVPHFFKGEFGEAPAGDAASFKEIARAFGVSVASVEMWRLQGAPIEPRRPNNLAAIHRWRQERGHEPMGVATSNYYLAAAKAFGQWLVRERRWPENPFAHLAALNARVDVRRERRALTSNEFDRLVAAARVGQPFHGLDGRSRSVLYIVASHTGLRVSELASLAPASIDMEGSPPTIAVDASYSKRRRRDILPLRNDVAGLLRQIVADAAGDASGKVPFRKGPRMGHTDAKLWPGTWHRRAAEMLRVDLEAAEIPFADAAGRVADFHSLRHGFITNLARGGVHPKDAQSLARHSTITLTMDRYSHVSISDLTGALERLPALPPDTPAKQADVLQVTGTSDATSDRLADFVAVPVAGNVAGSPVPVCLLLSAIGEYGDSGGGPKDAKTPEGNGGFVRSSPRLSERGAGGSRTHAGGFAIRCLSLLATAPDLR